MKDNQPEPSALITEAAEAVLLAIINAGCIIVDSRKVPIRSTLILSSIQPVLESFRLALECAREPIIIDGDISTRLTEIKARTSAASAGPWACWDGFKMSADCHAAARIGPNDGYSGLRAPTASIIGTKADLEFVACAREDVPWLIEQIEGRRGPKVEDAAIAQLIGEARAITDEDAYWVFARQNFERLITALEQQITARQEAERRLSALRQELVKQGHPYADILVNMIDGRLRADSYCDDTGSWPWALSQMKAGRRVKLPSWICDSIDIGSVAGSLHGWFRFSSGRIASIQPDWLDADNWQLADVENE